MNVTIPDSLKDFIQRQVGAGRYSNPDAYVADLVRTEAKVFERVGRGDPLPVDEHFDGRLEVLLDEGERSGDYVDVTKEGFDAMEREALELVRNRKSF